MTPLDRFLKARDLLFARRDDHDAAVREFAWPELDSWNWATDYFDALAAGNRRPALVVVDEMAEASHSVSFEELAEKSRRVARYLTRLGVGRGDRVLIMLGNIVPLWEAL